MNILMDIGHPGHVHLLRNCYFELVKNNHLVLVTVKDIPIAKQLLKLYKIDYIEIGTKKDSIIQKGLSQLKYNWKIFNLVKKHNIELGIGSSITLAHISKITPMKSIILDDDDDEVEPLFVKYAHPFANVVLSPDVLKGKRKKKECIFYAGYHELAYLHPNKFKPDIKVLNDLMLDENDKFFIMRFNVFKAHHDIDVIGLTLDQKLELINVLKPFGKVFITTEREIEPELKQYQLKISPEKTHSLMSYATIFLGDSQTMSSEAAVLGVPSIRCNSLAGEISYLEEEEHKYGLTYGFKPQDFEKLLNKVNGLLQNKNLKSDWEKKRNSMLKDKIDVSNFLVWFIENYPKSQAVMKKNPEYQDKFK